MEQKAIVLSFGDHPWSYLGPSKPMGTSMQEQSSTQPASGHIDLSIPITDQTRCLLLAADLLRTPPAWADPPAELH